MSGHACLVVVGADHRRQNPDTYLSLQQLLNITYITMYMYMSDRGLIRIFVWKWLRHVDLHNYVVNYVHLHNYVVNWM